ncbi:MAG: glycosyltransferase family 2 protein, partial [bacterium]|nr:glycosyltransferase family 2 protein [bacterium]
EIARRLGAIVMRHDPNRGYGAAQKTGYKKALEDGADVAVMVHADFQYDPTLIPQMVKPIADGKADVCFGSRMVRKSDAWRAGMPWWRFVANIALTLVEDAVFRLGLSEYHTGYRAYGCKVLESVPFEKNSDNYVFDTEMFAELSLGKFRCAEIAIPTRYLADSQSPSFAKSVEYGFMTLGVMGKFLLHKWGLKRYPQFEVNRAHV